MALSQNSPHNFQKKNKKNFLALFFNVIFVETVRLMNTEQIMLMAYKEEIAETNRHFPLAPEFANPAPEFTVTIGKDDMETRSSFECNKRKVMEYHSQRIELYLKHTNRG